VKHCWKKKTTDLIFSWGGMVAYHYKQSSRQQSCRMLLPKNQLTSDPAGARTQDPLLKREMLYQLSYGVSSL
jgi:hypothetical protein